MRTEKKRTPEAKAATVLARQRRKAKHVNASKPLDTVALMAALGVNATSHRRVAPAGSAELRRLKARYNLA